MSGPPFQGLQKHTEVVKDTLQGLLETYAQVPGLIHEASSKEASSGESMGAQQASQPLGPQLQITFSSITVVGKHTGDQCCSSHSL